MTRYVYIGTSLDGYIAASDGKLDWLEYVPNPEGSDLGFDEFMQKIDAVVMGRVTFETVLGFDMGWPYPVPGLILSRSMSSAPEAFRDKVSFTSGAPQEVIEKARGKGFENLYIDGGKTIQQFLRADLIDEMIISEIPILLGGGNRLFGPLDQSMGWELSSSEILLGQIVKRHLVRKRD